MWPGHLIIRSSGHPVILSSDHLICGQYPPSTLHELYPCCKPLITRPHNYFYKCSSVKHPEKNMTGQNHNKSVHVLRKICTVLNVIVEHCLLIAWAGGTSKPPKIHSDHVVPQQILGKLFILCIFVDGSTTVPSALRICESFVGTQISFMIVMAQFCTRLSYVNVKRLRIVKSCDTKSPIK